MNITPTNISLHLAYKTFINCLRCDLINSIENIPNGSSIVEDKVFYIKNMKFCVSNLYRKLCNLFEIGDYL